MVGFLTEVQLQFVVNEMATIWHTGNLDVIVSSLLYGFSLLMATFIFRGITGGFPNKYFTCSHPFYYFLKRCIMSTASFSKDFSMRTQRMADSLLDALVRNRNEANQQAI